MNTTSVCNSVRLCRQLSSNHATDTFTVSRLSTVAMICEPLSFTTFPTVSALIYYLIVKKAQR